MGKKIIFSLLAICLVAGMVGVGTWAYFSDIETSPGNYFVAGTLDLTVSGENPLTSTLFEVTNKAPGDAGVATVVAANIGSLDGNAFIHLRQTCNNDNGIEEPEDMVDGVLDGSDGTAKGDLPSNLYVKISVDGSVIAGGEGMFKDIRCNKLPLGVLEAGGSMTVKIEWDIPTWVGNIIQGDSLCFDIDFILDQKVGEAAFTIGNLLQDAVAVECDDTDISVDVTNTGTATGVVTVSVDIDDTHLEQTVQVEAEATLKVEFSTHLPVGKYDVVVSIPGMALDPCPIEVVAPGLVSFDWEEMPAAEIYVCDTIGWLVLLHNTGGVDITGNITLTVTVGGKEKYTETQGPITFEPCIPVVLSFGTWHAEDDPHEYSGQVVVDLDGAPGLSHSFTLVDKPPPMPTNISPTPMQQFEVGETVAIEASATDDVAVFMVLYCIDPEDPEDFEARCKAMAYDDVSKTWKAGWDTSIADPPYTDLGVHGVVVVALDTLMQPSVECITPVILYGVEWTFEDLVIPDEADPCDDVAVTVTITNTGTIPGSYSVPIAVTPADGVTGIETKTGALDPGYSDPLAWTLHFTDGGTYTVTVDGLTAELIEITEPPLTWTPDDSWTFQVHYDDGMGFTEDDHFVSTYLGPVTQPEWVVARVTTAGTDGGDGFPEKLKMTYTNQDGTPNRESPTKYPIRIPPDAAVDTVVYVTLQEGDTGVQSVQGITEVTSDDTSCVISLEGPYTVFGTYNLKTDTFTAGDTSTGFEAYDVVNALSNDAGPNTLIVERYNPDLVQWITIADPTDPLPFSHGYYSLEGLDYLARDATIRGLVGDLTTRFSYTYLDPHGYQQGKGSSWRVLTHADIFYEGALFLGVDSYAIATVEDDDVVITVPAGTFTCKHIVSRESDESWTPTTTVLSETWWTETAKNQAKYQDFRTYVGEELQELDTYFVQ